MVKSADVEQVSQQLKDNYPVIFEAVTEALTENGIDGMDGLKEFVNGLDVSGLEAVYNVLSQKFAGMVSANPDLVDQLKSLSAYVASVAQQQ